VIGRLILRADGTGTNEFYDRLNPENSKAAVTLRWTVKGGMVTYVATAVSRTDLVKVGSSLSDRILELSRDRLVYELRVGYDPQEVGRKETRVREQEANQ
jgi:hypothetical protein